MTEAAQASATPHPLLAVWQQHVFAEFVSKDVEAALATMTEDAHVLLVPVGTGGRGKEGVRVFYGTSFIPGIPPDLVPTPISQTIGTDCIVEEAVYAFTHSIPMDWMIPGVPPTNKRIEVAVVGIIKFRDGKVAHEHLYWDHASVLAQLGILDAGTFPILGAESARNLLEYADQSGAPQ
jgi:carboxymethylenebutenolidase